MSFVKIVCEIVRVKWSFKVFFFFCHLVLYCKVTEWIICLDQIKPLNTLISMCDEFGGKNKKVKYVNGWCLITLSYVLLFNLSNPFVHIKSCLTHKVVRVLWLLGNLFTSLHMKRNEKPLSFPSPGRKLKRMSKRTTWLTKLMHSMLLYCWPKWMFLKIIVDIEISLKLDSIWI